VGDSLLIIDGQLHASNCNKSGYSVPAVLILNGANDTTIEVQTRGEGLPNATLNAIAAGPNLVSLVNGTPTIDIPQHDDNINIIVGTGLCVLSSFLFTTYCSTDRNTRRTRRWRCAWRPTARRRRSC
jgi:hypothetical protein